MSNFKSNLNFGSRIIFIFSLIQLISCKEKEDPFPEGFERVAGFQLMAVDSVFLVRQGEQILRIYPKFLGVYSDEITLNEIPQMQFYIDGIKSSNPPTIFLGKEREFEVHATIGKLRSRTLKIRVVDVDPKTFVSDFKVSMADSTRVPYAIAGKSLVDFKVSILDYKGREFPEENKPAYKFYFDGRLLENHHRVFVHKSGEIPFWFEIGDKKSNVEILHSRELPDFSKTYTLPVVFHVIHSGQPVGSYENPTQETISLVLDKTNNWMMGRTESEFRKGHNQIDPNIELYLASIGPDGNLLEEPGINRFISEKTSFSYNDASTYKYLFDRMWNPKQYINIFLFNLIDVGGFAALPPGDDLNPLTRFYGIAVPPNVDESLLTHELGHFFGLPHTFSSGNFCADVDGFLDTDSYNDDLKKTNGLLKTNCEGEFFYGTNFMDYWPAEWNSFTLEQVVRMRTTIENGYFLPESSSPDQRIYPRSWTRGVFDKTIKPISCNIHNH